MQQDDRPRVRSDLLHGNGSPAQEKKYNTHTRLGSPSRAQRPVSPDSLPSTIVQRFDCHRVRGSCSTILHSSIFQRIKCLPKSASLPSQPTCRALQDEISLLGPCTRLLRQGEGASKTAIAYPPQALPSPLFSTFHSCILCTQGNIPGLWDEAPMSLNHSHVPLPPHGFRESGSTSERPRALAGDPFRAVCQDIAFGFLLLSHHTNTTDAGATHERTPAGRRGTSTQTECSATEHWAWGGRARAQKERIQCNKHTEPKAELCASWRFTTLR